MAGTIDCPTCRYRQSNRISSAMIADIYSINGKLRSARSAVVRIFIGDNDMFGLEPLTPAYGRDYRSLKALEADLVAGKDFLASSGQYCSIRDLLQIGQRNVRVRYSRLRKTGIIDLMPYHNQD